MMTSLELASPVGLIRISEHDGFIVELRFLWEGAPKPLPFKWGSAPNPAAPREVNSRSALPGRIRACAKRVPLAHSAPLRCGWDSDGVLHFGNQSVSALQECTSQLKAYFAGELQDFTLPVKIGGTPFQQTVWKTLLTIPYGETIPYKELAVRIGNPKAIRAVGGANNKNPISIILPCHRVIGSDGKLVGYGGGLDAKKFLLNLEKGE